MFVMSKAQRAAFEEADKVRDREEAALGVMTDYQGDRDYARAVKSQYGYDPQGSTTGPLEVVLCIAFPPLLLVYGFVWWGRHRRRRFHERGF